MRTETVTPFRVVLSDSDPVSGVLASEIAVNIDPTTARRRVSGWASGEVATSCGGGTPQLVIGRAKLFWRVPVIFTRTGIGAVGEVGVVNLDAQTGQLDVTNILAVEMQHSAAQLAERLAAGK
jgi:hypothetical protein